MGTEIVVHQATDELACASMPNDEIVTWSVESYVWWLLVLLCFAVAINLICCLCFAVYFVKQKRALRVDISTAPAAATGERVRVTALVQLTPSEVQRGIAEAMRADRAAENQVYHFTPTGGKYHLAGCFITERNPRSFGLTPCARCAVGRLFPIYEGAERQVFFADTKNVRGPAAHYHVDRMCGRTYEMGMKDMCLHCVDVQKMKMQIARLTLNRPFSEQELFAGREPPREEVMPYSEQAANRARQWG